MSNIFKDAYFGKAYKTRDGRKALYLYNSGIFHHLIIEKDVEPKRPYFADGYYEYSRQRTKQDIVSEWREEVSEDELDELADNACYFQYLGEPRFDSYSLKQGFKVGYLNALGRI